MGEGDKAKKTRRRVIAIAVFATFGPVVAALILRIFVVEAFKVPAGSMIPTVLVGDHMFVRKWIKKAERGDVVVFRYPENPSVDFVKRVVAVGGDDIEVLDGRPSVNGKLARQCYVGPFTMEGRTQELYLERLGDRVYGVLHTRKIDEQTCSGSEGCASPLQCHQGLCVESVQGPWRVPQNELWVLGDNRDNSHDSRMWSHGEGRGVPLENVIGQPSFLFFSQAQGRAGKDVGGPPLLGGNQSSLAPELEKCVTELSR